MLSRAPAAAGAVLALLAAQPASAQTSIRIMPPERSTFAVGQRFDLRVEATGTGSAPRGLRVTVDGIDVTARNVLDPGAGDERGAGGTGATAASLAPAERTAAAGPSTTNLLVRGFSLRRPGAPRHRGAHGRRRERPCVGRGALVAGPRPAPTWPGT